MTAASWERLLLEHVQWDAAGVSTTVDYAGFLTDRETLERYLSDLTAVTRDQYDGWSGDEQLAFLINAYNAFTVELILTAYPDLESIRDLGSPFRSPWKRRFFRLLGEERHLDELEHEMIRGHFREPRIHFAVNCASIGCPALRPEPYVAARLDAQLEDQTRRFLSDSSRNRADPASGALAVSRIFRWYAEDFRAGWRGTQSVRDFLGLYADALTADAALQARIRAGDLEVRYLPYDWRLNAGSGP